MNKARREFCVAAVALTALAMQALGMGNVDWGGREPHPAVVNPVCGYEEGTVLDLGGEWTFATGGFAADRSQFFNMRQHKEPWPGERKIVVPGTWESQGVGEAVPATKRCCYAGYETCFPLTHCFVGDGWYRRTFEIPAAWKGKRIWLKIGGVGCQGWFWVNDMPVAHVFDYCATRKFEITDLVEPGKAAKFVVEVSNAAPSKLGTAEAVSCFGGILRPLELEATPKTFIDDAWVRGDFDKREAEAHVAVACGDGDKCKIENGKCKMKDYALRFTIDGQTVERSISQSCTSTNSPFSTLNFTFAVPLAELRPWSPEHPNLYTGIVELVENGTVVQTRRERFGVRKLEVRGDSFYLNGRPYFLRGFGDDSIYPLTGMPPADREAHLVHLRKARAAGFNFVRLHTHCEVPEYFEAADEVGILVQPELPYYTDVPTEAFTFDPLRDLRELYEHYRRYPSFAVYCGGNEGRLGPYVEREMYAFVKRTDPDRLVNHQDGDRCAWQECDDDEGSNDPGNSDYDIGPRDVWPRGKFNTGRPFVCHEYLNLCVKQDTRLEPLYTGAWAVPDSRADRAAWLAERGLDLAWGDALQDAQHTLQGVYQKRGIEWARKDPYCDGYCFWTAVDVVVANGPIHSAQGLFDPFWQTKQGGLSPEQFALFNGTSAVLLDKDCDGQVFISGDVLNVDFLFAHYGDAELSEAVLEWRIDLEGSQTDATNCVPPAGRIPLGDISIGSARKVASAKIAFPEVDRPVKATLVVEVNGRAASRNLLADAGASGALIESALPDSSIHDGRAASMRPPLPVANEWNFWIFPKRTKKDGSDIAVDAALLPALAKLYDGVLDAASPVAARAKVVIAPYGSKTAADALARGQRVLAISGGDGKPNISLGWWSMGNQVGTALAKGHPALAGLPHEGAMTPLLFRIVKEGAHPLSEGGLKLVAPLIVGEGRKDCYLYLGEVAAEKGRLMASFGLDLLSGTPEGTALLDSIIDELR